MSGNPGRRFRVEQRYQNFRAGKAWTRVLPKTYRTRRGAAAAAARLCWTTKPSDDAPVTEASQGDVVEVGHRV